MKKPNKIVLFIQAFLTIVTGTVTLVMFARLFQGSPDLLTILSSIIFLIMYLFIVFYAVKNYKGDDIHYKYCVYGYAALLGIEILYSGKLIASMGLSDNMTLLVNICNLIAFANVIKFSDVLEDRKRSLYYMGIACFLKLAVECFLIIKLIAFVKLIHILTSLSVPILGFTLLAAYMYKYGD